MSQPTNETPICERSKVNFHEMPPEEQDRRNGEYVPLSVAQAIERAANELAAALRSSDNHEFGCHIRATKALAAFASLKGAKG